MHKLVTFVTFNMSNLAVDVNCITPVGLHLSYLMFLPLINHNQ